MTKLVLVVGVICAVLIAESTCQRVRLMHPTYRPPPQRPIIIRTAREAPAHEPLWLYSDADIPRAPSSADHPLLPSIIDDVKLDLNRRIARSLPRLEPWSPTPFNPRVPLPDFPTPRPLLPRYARYASDVEDVQELDQESSRVARSLPSLEPWRPTPFNPRVPLPDFPTPRPLFPTYARYARDVEDVEELDQKGSRVAGSLSTSRASRGGDWRSSGIRYSGRILPGYNRRNSRYAPRYSRPTPFNPRALYSFPRPGRRSPFTTLNRVERDVGSEMVDGHKDLYKNIDFDGQKDIYRSVRDAEFDSQEDFSVVDG